MKRLLLSLALVAFSGAAFAAKISYSGEALADATVESILAKHAAETKQEVPESTDKVLVLVNGSREGFAPPEIDSKLASATSVEVLSNDDTFVINIITK